eukprot:m.467164 g.467164  ORF g.467164 m.467164 type:complete len:69 (+) comp25999_c0_seq1:844-1050(+)
MSGDKGGAIFEAMRKTLTTRPYTLVHGDLAVTTSSSPRMARKITRSSTSRWFQPDLLRLTWSKHCACP